MPISKSQLSEDEEVLVDLRPHWLFFQGPVLVSTCALAVAVGVIAKFPKAPTAIGIGLIVIVAIPLLWLLGRVARWLGTSLVLTNTRLILRSGVVGRKNVQLRLQRVSEVHFNQSLFDRMLGTGQLIVEVLGQEGSVLVNDVRHPGVVQRVINTQLDVLNNVRHGSEQSSPFGVAQNAQPDAPPGPSVQANIEHSGPPTLTPPGSLTTMPNSSIFPNYVNPHIEDPTPPHGVAIQTPTPFDGESILEDAADSLEPISSTGSSTGSSTELAADSPTGPTSSSIHDQLVELDDLRRRGIVTDAEFEAKKTELLDRI